MNIENKEIIISNDIENLYERVNSFLLSIKNICEENLLLKIEIALYELVLNAIEHGNLGITFCEKDRACKNRLYDNLLNERMTNPRYMNRRVVICYRLRKKNICFCVEDEGDGFDWKETFRIAEEEDLRPNGRGIIMAKTIFDKLEYNNKGNTVTAYKLL